MTTKIGINGFGRIGRFTLRAMKKYHKDNLEVVAITTWRTPRPMPTYSSGTAFSVLTRVM